MKRLASAGGWALLLAAASMGCAPAPRPAADPSTPAASSPTSPLRPDASSTAGAPESRGEVPSKTSSVLHAEEAIVELEIPGWRPAVVSLPVGASGARPVLVATHGAGGSPLWHCEVWREIVQNRAFVLCPRGMPIGLQQPGHEVGYFYDGHPALGREIDQAFKALRERYGAFVDPGAPVFAGYSQGASMGSMVLPSHPARFSRAVLIEGGFGDFHEWNVAAARRFRDQGGVRVLLACGREKCAKLARTTARYMSRGGLEARVLYAEGVGQYFGGDLARQVRDAFAWLTEGDTRW
jgi:predicted esterase